MVNTVWLSADVKVDFVSIGFGFGFGATGSLARSTKKKIVPRTSMVLQKMLNMQV